MSARNEAAEWLRRAICTCGNYDHAYYCPVHDLNNALQWERKNIRARLDERHVDYWDALDADEEPFREGWDSPADVYVGRGRR